MKVKEQVRLPAMASLSSEGGSRSNVDLFCVIDVSGSMNGQKIQLVKETLEFMVEMLTPGDRISLITFNGSGQRICPLLRVNDENSPKLNGMIKSIYAAGGTNINAGLSLAVKSIAERRQANMVTSIFLLSDGQDRSALTNFQQELAAAKADLGVYTLHSFGFGADHDEDLMTKLSQLKDGTFYFVKDPSLLDEAFSNALGGIISVVASELTLYIGRIGMGRLNGVHIPKTYGPMWKVLPNGDFEIKQLQLLSGARKDFVFEVEIPHLDFLVGDVDRSHEVLMASFAAKMVDGKTVDGETRLSITLLNPEELIPEDKEDIEVVENFFRVKAAEAIEVGVGSADQRRFTEAQGGLDKMIQAIEANPRVRKDRVQHVVEDLRQVREKCSER